MNIKKYSAHAIPSFITIAYIAWVYVSHSTFTATLVLLTLIASGLLYTMALVNIQNNATHKKEIRLNSLKLIMLYVRNAGGIEDFLNPIEDDWKECRRDILLSRKLHITLPEARMIVLFNNDKKAQERIIEQLIEETCAL